jgi:peptidoglycan/xylan/chitin deacetylase (PgdA/CDA1 family)
MQETRYLLRFDDVCPTMNWKAWEGIERHLVLHGVKPILAVVPDNQDPGLKVDPAAPDFWERVRRWQGMGYAIALHGYQHVYVNQDPGLMRLTPHSEFAGLPYQAQVTKLHEGLRIFREQGVHADAWVAPSHSFDATTLEALVDVGLNVISDGLWPWPHADQGRLFWVPQQLWQFEPKPAGLWTVCNHANSWTEQTVAAFGRELAHYAPLMTDLTTVVRDFAGRTLTLEDRASAFCNLLWNHRIKPPLGAVRRRLAGIQAVPS